MEKDEKVNNLCLTAAGTPRENAVLETPYAKGKARALALRVGETMKLAGQFAEEAGFTLPPNIHSGSKEFEEYWQFVDGFLETISSTGLALDSDGTILSFVTGNPRSRK